MKQQLVLNLHIRYNMTYSINLSIFTDKFGRNVSKTQFPNVCVVDL
jgi:hypothetical protein